MIRMKRNRIILFLLWVLSLVGISFYGGPISYGFFVVLTLIPIISVIYMICVFVLFKIYQSLENRDITCNRTEAFYFTLQNESPVSFFGVRVMFYSSFSTISGLDDKTEYELKPHSGIKKRTNIVCRYRGEYEVGIKKVVIQDFFRLFSYTYNNKEPFRIIVKPDIVRLERLLHGDVAVNTVKDSLVNKTFPDVLTREYVSGDDPRLINWKVSGAAGKLMVRDMISEQQQGVGIIMDSCRYSDRIDEYLPVENKILEAAIALNLYFSEKGIPVSTYYETTDPEESLVYRENGFDAFYDRMCGFSFKDDHSNELLMSHVMSQGSVFTKRAVFMIVHVWDEAVTMMVQELNKNAIPVIIYVISDEEDISFERISRVDVVRIPTESDLREVM